MNRHPDFKLCVPTTENEYGYDIFDVEDELADEFPKDSLDIWYCDECGCPVVFYSDYRVDYAPMNPVEAAMNFQFKYRYKVSVDMKYIYGYDSNYNIVIGFGLKQDRALNKDMHD